MRLTKKKKIYYYLSNTWINEKEKISLFYVSFSLQISKHDLNCFLEKKKNYGSTNDLKVMFGRNKGREEGRGPTLSKEGRGERKWSIIP